MNILYKMLDLRAAYFAGATYMFCTSVKQVNNLFHPSTTMTQYLFNCFVLGLSSGLLFDSVNQLLKEN